jgi:hypothetical protein
MKQWVHYTSFVFTHTREAKDVSAYDLSKLQGLNYRVMFFCTVGLPVVFKNILLAELKRRAFFVPIALEKRII